MSAKKTSIGGQALLEGIMMRGPKVTAMAVRNPEGEIILEEHPTRGTERAKFFKLPIIRGVFNMVDSLAAGYKYLMRSAEISGVDAEEEKRKAENPKWYDAPIVDKLLMPIATVLAVVLAVVLFFWLPMQLFTWLSAAVPALDGHYLLRAVFEGVLRILIFIGYVWATSLMKDIRRTYQYHGAEHKTIFCYEAGLPLTVENVRVQRRFHPRCGTSFLILVLLVSIVVSMFIRIDNVPLRMFVKLLTLPLIIGIGYELIKLAGRKDNLLTRIISAPGIALQHLTVFEPDDSMIECAIAAMKKVIPDDGSDTW
ncbi:MAG TPA: DUF1385 domain-containing protein [Candidatus Faecivicinus avistercoris]|nr:DUF1385 domain-containing protein [Candidatus Faecivicinus avistercoris]